MNPDARDSTTQQIQSKLGNYSLVKHLLDEPKRLIGIEGVPPSPAPPSTSSFLRMSSSSVGANSRSSPSSQEFKKPGGPRPDASSSSSSCSTSSLTSSSSSSSSSSSTSTSSSSHQRGGFVKPADGKPPYGGRGGYPGQPVKHGGNSNDHRSHGLLPAKGPPTNSPGNGTLAGNSSIGNSSGSRLHCVGSRLSRLPLDNVSIDFHCFVATAASSSSSSLFPLPIPPPSLSLCSPLSRLSFLFTRVVKRRQSCVDFLLEV